MYISYLDETGDDGYPQYSSGIFTLTAFYLHYQNWKTLYDLVYSFRKQLKEDYNFPVKLEMHTKKFLLNKNPYRRHSFSNDERLEIMDLFSKMIAALDGKIVNVAIIKNNITNADYKVLDKAMTYLVQRIENDLTGADPMNRFMMISDPGRIGKMKKTTRRIQRINFIPSKMHPGSYRKEIKTLIEDPLEKDSKESYFIQIADFVSFIVYQYVTYSISSTPAKRLTALISEDKIKEWLEIMKPTLNLRASNNDEYGVVMYPR